MARPITRKKGSQPKKATTIKPNIQEKPISKEPVKVDKEPLKVEPQKAPIEIKEEIDIEPIKIDPPKETTSSPIHTAPPYGEITDVTKKDIYILICRLKGLNLSSRNPIIQIFEKNTMTLKSLAALKQKDINEETIDAVFHMYRNICTNKETFKTDDVKKILIKDIAPTLTDIIEYTFKFVKNTYKRRQVIDKDHGNRTYRDAIESLHDRTI